MSKSGVCISRIKVELHVAILYGFLKMLSWKSTKIKISLKVVLGKQKSSSENYLKTHKGSKGKFKAAIQ